MKIRRPKQTAMLVMCAFVLMFTVRAAQADSYRVDWEDEDIGDENPGDGVCRASKLIGYSTCPGICIPKPIYQTGCTLRAAIEEANAHAPVPSTIVFNAFGPRDFFFKEVRTITLSGGALRITTPVTISGASSGRPAYQFIINGSGSDRIFEIQGPAVTIEGVTLAGGKATAAQQDGGAIYSTGGRPALAAVLPRGKRRSRCSILPFPITRRTVGACPAARWAAASTRTVSQTTTT
jgi:hypothetical protein